VTIVCPGPVAPNAGEGTTRSLYGPKGPIQRQEVPDSKRMPAPRAVELIANAMAAGVAECWLARQPVLTMGKGRMRRCRLGSAVQWQNYCPAECKLSGILCILRFGTACCVCPML
jgi:hypothetical protein